jgi:hypothetical protein
MPAATHDSSMMNLVAPAVIAKAGGGWIGLNYRFAPISAIRRCAKCSRKPTFHGAQFKILRTEAALRE